MEIQEVQKKLDAIAKSNEGEIVLLPQEAFLLSTYMASLESVVGAVTLVPLNDFASIRKKYDA